MGVLSPHLGVLSLSCTHVFLLPVLGGPRVRAHPRESHLAVQTQARAPEASGSTPHAQASLSEFITEHASNRTGYEASWKTWTEYRTALEASVRPHPFLEGLSDREKSLCLSIFVHHLYQKKGLRGSALNRIMSNLKMVFLEALADVEMFESPLVQRAKFAGKPTKSERSALSTTTRANQSLPLSLDILWPMREEF